MQSNFSIILGFIELINIYLSIKNLRAMEYNSFKRACKTLVYAKRKNISNGVWFENYGSNNKRIILRGSYGALAIRCDSS
ncbi:MAG: hypothetical protein ACLSV2_04900 [Clostridium sp.]